MKRILTALLFLGNGLASSASYAQDQAAATATIPFTKSNADRWQRWSFAVQLGSAQGDVNAFELENALQSAAGFAQVRNLDESSFSWGLNLSYCFTPHWSLELGVLALGDYSSNIDIRNADPASIRNILADQHPVGGTGLRAAIRTQKQLLRWSPSFSVGFFQSSGNDINAIIDGQNFTVEGEDFSVLIDVAIGYRLSRHWSTEFALSYLKLNQTIVKPALALRFTL